MSSGKTRDEPGTGTPAWRPRELLVVVALVGAGALLGALGHRAWSRPAKGSASVSVDVARHARGATTLVIALQEATAESAIVGAELAEGMHESGVSAAALTFRLSPETTMGVATRDVAVAIADIARPSGGEPSRVILVGRGVGAWMAALLALDRTILEGAGFDARRIRGVIGIGGTYDLRDDALEGSPDRHVFRSFVKVAERAASSPIALAPAASGADAPAFLLLDAGSDHAAWPRQARAFARAVERAGGRAEHHVLGDRDAHGIARFPRADPLGDFVRSFVTTGLVEMSVDSAIGVQQRWNKAAPLDHDDLRRDQAMITTHAVDAPFVDTMMGLFHLFPHELHTLPGKTYEAVDLLSYLASRPESEVGRGDHLVVTNIRGEQLRLTRQDLEKTRPVVVVGVDDETNLFRVLGGYYRLAQAYSWKPPEGRMPMMVRPLGAFLHFPNSPPRALVNKTYAPYGLTGKSFRWVASDPLAPVRNIGGVLGATLTGEQGCLTCHSFRGAGAKAHHVRAADGQAHGAFALPFEEYPPEVLRRFLFEQEAVAKSFDVKPLLVDPEAAHALLAAVTAARGER